MSADAVRRVAAHAFATTLATLAWSSAAIACPVCFAADERARASFLGTAVLLSALPFALALGLAFWFWRELGRTAGSPTRAGGGSARGSGRSVRSIP
jgi:hypothetical protein